MAISRESSRLMVIYVALVQRKYFCEVLIMSHQSRDSHRDQKLKQLAIQKIAQIADHSSEYVKSKAIDSIEKIVIQSEQQKSYTARFIEPVALSIIASLLWENGIKKVAAWIAATLFRASMVSLPAIVHVALNTLLS